MLLKKHQLKEFEELVEPIIKYLNDNFHPHVTVIINPIGAELVEGIATHHTEKFLKD